MQDEAAPTMESADDVRLLVTTAPPDLAEEIAHALVEARVAACVNVLPGVRSVYRWEGAVQNDPESVLLAKTTTQAAPALVREIRARHPYEVPEILLLPIQAGDAAYLAWLRDAVG